MTRTTTAALLAAIATISLTNLACEADQPPPTGAEREALLADQPEIFVERDGHLALEGLPGVWVTQPKDEALAAIEALCDDPMEYRVGDLGGNAWFRGCEFDEPRDGVVSVRVGFWPRIDDRVAVVEVKRQGLAPAVVRERFRDRADITGLDMVRPHYVQMEGERYQMVAAWDEGLEGPARISAGLTQKAGNALEGQK